MKSLIKPLLVAVLIAALCHLLGRFVVPYTLMFLIPEGWGGSWAFWANSWVSGFIAGLVVVRLLPAQRYYVVPMLISVFAVIAIGGYVLNRCNAGQLAAINQLSEQSWSSLSYIGKPDAATPPQEPLPPVDLTDAPGVTQEGQSYGYSCVRPGETVDYFLALQMSYGAHLLGLMLALLLTHRYRRTPASRQA
jgi:hypothetical protein